jgi:phosphoribosylformimino-5-aminoimidazole carboxamide ribotide isomerase
MEIVPAIYLLNQQCVALYKGSFEQKDVYRRSPLEYVRQFIEEGASSLLIVDLDKSEFGTDVNKDLIREIREATDIPLILAGRIRTMEAIDEAFDNGMNYVVLGVSAEAVYKDSLKKYGADKIIVGVKAKGDEVLTDQKRDFPLRVIDFAERLPEFGFKKILYKDVWKEGTEIHPNYDEIDRILRMTPLEVYASGGIGRPKHLKTLKEIGVKGAVIGKALYERDIDLAESIQNFS